MQVQLCLAAAVLPVASASPSVPDTATDPPAWLCRIRNVFSIKALIVPDQAFLMNASSNPARRRTLALSRLRKHSDYLSAYAASRKHRSANMSWFVAPQTQLDADAPNAGRVGLTVGKVLGKAHQRNRIKRRMREALRRHVELLPHGFDLIFHPRRTVLTIEFAQLEAEIVRILELARSEAARGVKPSVSMPRSPVTHAP